MKKNNHICIGSIGKPRGLKGEFFLNSFCNPPENILNYINDILINDQKLKLDYIKKSNTKFHSKIKDINDLDKVKEYTNTKIYISSDNLPVLPPDELYWHELKGMLVIDINEKEILGVVDGLNNFGANDCLIVKPTNKSIDNKERLIPYIKETFIQSVDKEKKLVNVNWKSDY
tara:strand:+ start:86 stop:604 length:519 start_codon:yes stop_codon:yes gene_type:complete